jgi:hypothetical protein
MTTIVILNAVFAGLAVGVLAAVKLAAYHFAGKEHAPAVLPVAQEERLAA